MLRRSWRFTQAPLPSNALKISVTGGTGFVGRALANFLSEHGHEVRLVRRAAHRGPFGQPHLTADFSNPTSLAAAFRGADAVVHLVGIISECGTQTYESVHTWTTRVVLEAARLAGVRRFLHMSALGTREGARSRYHASKWEGEQAVRASRLDWTIFRPSLIHGAEDGFTRLFARIAARSPIVPVMGKGRNLMQPIAVAQVARAFGIGLSTPGSVGRCYDLCGGERLSFLEILRAILLAEGRKRLLLRIPMPVARLQATALEWAFPAILRRPPPLNRDQLLMLEEDNVGDGSEANTEFGLSHRPFAEEMRRLAARNIASAP